MAIKPKINSDLLLNNVSKRADYKMVDRVFGNDSFLKKSSINFNGVALADITPRPINEYSQTRIENLAESIEKTNHNLIHPIVIVKPSDLPADSKVLAKYKEAGVDVNSVKYMIVAGERRYRAFSYNKDKWSKEHPDASSNPYEYITARVLTELEAKNEEIFYKDSNDQARQLTPIEAMLHIKDIIARVKTNEDKRNCLIEQYGEEDIPTNPDKAAKEFRMDKYIKFYLSKELGIEGWELTTIRTFVMIVNNCDDKIIEALKNNEFPSTEARNIAKFPHSTQVQLLEMYKNSTSAYYNEMKARKNDKPSKKITVSDAKKQIKTLSKSITENKVRLTAIAEELGKTDRDNLQQIIDMIDELNSKIEDYKNK